MTKSEQVAVRWAKQTLQGALRSLDKVDSARSEQLAEFYKDGTKEAIEQALNLLEGIKDQ